MVINQLNAASIPVYNAQVPSEGPKALPQSFEFDTTGIATLDLSLPMQQGVISQIQSIFIDASSCDHSVSVSVGNIGIPISVKAHTQGYYPICAPNPCKLTFNGTSADVLRFILLNVPIAPGQWATV